MILFRAFPWDAKVGAGTRGGALWFPRMLQGSGRHDNPTIFGCLYVSQDPLSPVVERLARFAGRALTEDKLVSRGLPVALAALDLPDDVQLIDLDDPAVLEREGLRPSRVATHDRSVTQQGAAELFETHTGAAGLRWWSTFESLWANVTLFDRAEASLSVEDVRPLELGDDVVVEAADFLGLPIST
ncbi:MAG: hypothetical protein ABI649_04460 [Gaiellaceae bacterium]